MRKLLKHSTFNSGVEASDQSRLWMLRKLVGLGGAKQFVLPHGFSDDHLAEALKLDSWIDGQGPEPDIGRIRAELRRMHIAAESEKAPNDPPRRDWFRQPAPRIPRFNLLPAPVSDVGYWRKADVRAAKLQKVSNALAP